MCLEVSHEPCDREQLWSESQGPDDSRENLVDASATFISVDNVGAFVTMGELGQCKEVQKVVLPKFCEKYRDAKVIAAEEVLTLRPQE